MSAVQGCSQYQQGELPRQAMPLAPQQPSCVALLQRGHASAGGALEGRLSVAAMGTRAFRELLARWAAALLALAGRRSNCGPGKQARLLAGTDSRVSC